MKVDQTLLGGLIVVLMAVSSTSADTLPLPRREAPVPQTTNTVPHVQIGTEPNPAISAELLKRVSEIPGVEIRPTVISRRGALGFWISDDVALARPDVIVGGREFAHLHPDGSLHTSLPPDLAQAAFEAGWAAPHPWADQRPGWERFVMIFTPTNSEELDAVYDLVVQSYAFVTGRDASSF